MPVRRHCLPSAVFTALAHGGGGPAALRYLVAAQRSKHLLLLRAVLRLAVDTGHPHAEAARTGFESLAAMNTKAPAAVSALVSYPAVGAWALRTVLLLQQGRTEAVPGHLACVAAAAAIRGRTPLVIDVPVTSGTVVLPSLGSARLHNLPASATVRCHGDGAEIVAGRAGTELPADPRTAAGRWRGIRQLSVTAGGRQLTLLVDDLDPNRFPGMVRDRDRLCDADAAAWHQRLRAGWRILVDHHPQVAAEVATATSVLTPLPSVSSGQVSATSRQAFGCVAASLPPDGRSAALTFAHEIQHAKMTALMDLFKLVSSDPRARFHVPWRRDSRPATAVLHGAYAHTGVAAFWARQRHHERDPAAAHRANTEFALWRRASYDAARRLLASNGLLTETGRSFVGCMLQRLTALTSEELPCSAVIEAENVLDGRRVQQRL